MMNMNKCEGGDRLLLRNGEVAIYIGKRDNIDYPHEILYKGVKMERTNKGTCYSFIGNTCKQPEDVISFAPSSTLGIKKLFKEAFNVGCNYIRERNYIDSDLYTDCQALEFDMWLKNKADKIDTIISNFK